MGKRLKEYTRDNTKCMVKVNGEMLIDRVMNHLERLGVGRVVVVTGYKGEALRKHLGNRHGSLPIEYVDNPDYSRTNNIYSLWLAKDRLQEDDTLLLESDLIFDYEMIEALARNPEPNLALTAKYEPWMDGTMVQIDKDCNIVNFVPKKAFDFRYVDTYYKTVNIYKFSREFSTGKYVPFLEAYIKAVGNNEYYENVLSIITFLNSSALKALPVEHGKWYEIDDKQDLDIAELIFAPDGEILQKLYGRRGGFWRVPRMLDFFHPVNVAFASSKIADELAANFRILLPSLPSSAPTVSLLASKNWNVKEEYVVVGGCVEALVSTLMRGALAGGAVERLSNPNRITGRLILRSELLERALEMKKSGGTLIVDETAIDFCDNPGEASLLSNDILAEHPEIVVVKDIAETYGVAGLQLGMLCSSNVGLVNAVLELNSCGVNAVAEFFLQILSKYEADFERSCNALRSERDNLADALSHVEGLQVVPSQGDSIFCATVAPVKADEIALSLLKKHGIAVRVVKEPACKGLRFAVRGSADNRRLVSALHKVVEHCKE